MPTRPTGRRPGGAQAKGYTAGHQEETKRAIAAAPWCHTWPSCPHADAGTDANPLQGGHPKLKAECRTEAEWRAQQVVPQCRRCNSGHRPVRAPNGSGIG